MTSSFDQEDPALALAEAPSCYDPVDPDELGVGAVITYQMESGRPQVVTHRVVAVVNAIDGERRFLTQGDANEEADPEPAWLCTNMPYE